MGEAGSQIGKGMEMSTRIVLLCGQGVLLSGQGVMTVAKPGKRNAMRGSGTAEGRRQSTLPAARARAPGWKKTRLRTSMQP